MFQQSPKVRNPQDSYSLSNDLQKLNVYSLGKMKHECLYLKQLVIKLVSLIY